MESGPELQSQPDVDSLGYGRAYELAETGGAAQVLVICEHASNRIPVCLNSLGLSGDVLQSHVAWDPGALGVARALSHRLPAAMVSGNVSRLVYDCNRPPDAASAIPERSEVFDVPGNASLDSAGRMRRVEQVYEPFARAVSEQIKQHESTLDLVVTIHSFTPVYHGIARSVELGVLHGRDARFAEAMMQVLPATHAYETQLNAPYSAKDGVTHSLDVHGAANGLANVMIEIRNDLIETHEQQIDMAAYLSGWITATRVNFHASGVKT